MGRGKLKATHKDQILPWQLSALMLDFAVHPVTGTGAAPSPITEVFSSLPQAWLHELGRNEYLNGRFSVSKGVATRGVERQDSKLTEAGLRRCRERGC